MSLGNLDLDQPVQLAHNVQQAKRAEYLQAGRKVSTEQKSCGHVWQQVQSIQEAVPHP